jgi:hypothetical protein
LGIFPPVTPLEWALFCVKDIGLMVGLSCEGNEDQIGALLTAIGEDHVLEVKGVCSRGRRELLNLECFISYESTCMSSRRGKDKIHVFFSIERCVWVGFEGF